MSFLLRILFSGLIALVPSADGKEVTVLLLNVPHSYHTSDGAGLAHHQPLLLARAGNCAGDCPTDDSSVAQFVFADLSATAAHDALQTAVTGGGAWALSGSELSIRKGSSTDPALPDLVLQTGVRGTVNGQPQTIPTTSGEREDYSWIANLKQICPTCTLNTDMTTASVPPGLVAARLRLRTGKVFTYSVSRLGSSVAPVYFQRLDGQGTISPYSQAVANWVGADIAIGGDSIEIVEEKFNGDPGRSMKLSPDANGKVELAVLNLPSFVPPATTSSVAPEVGKHAELYYELASNAPASESRLVPRSGAASGVAPYSDVNWQAVHPTTAVYSELLSAIRLDIG
ncbi:MAG: hypothetical protein JWN02_1509, partial [Acidobacteria bacterium]|nr:hypothetical protein [Acidobacteriota bacterium]